MFNSQLLFGSPRMIFLTILTLTKTTVKWTIKPLKKATDFGINAFR